MKYHYLNSSIDTDNIVLPPSDKINTSLQKNNYAEIVKGINFLASDDVLLHVHGFMGTGKRQFINYISEFADTDVIKLEYYCRTSTVSDDILLNFIDKIEQSAMKGSTINIKIMTLDVKFQQYISTIKSPFLIILHSIDYILPENAAHIRECLEKVVRNSNVKVIVSTKAMMSDVLGTLRSDKKIFLKAFTNEIFKEFVESNGLTCSDTTLDDFYKYTRGYYYYTALTIKLMQAEKVSLNEFLESFAKSGSSFDNYLSNEYIKMLPTVIKNFFWFLKSIRHGLSFNALAVFDLYDEFSIEYLKTNLMVFQVDETLYVQDYFIQNYEIKIPKKTQIKLHKYIISIYEKELKEPIVSRSILISRQAFRAEIDYHNKCISDIENGVEENLKTIQSDAVEVLKPENAEKNSEETISDLEQKIIKAREYSKQKDYTSAIEAFLNIVESENTDLHTLAEIRLELARLYKSINEYKKSEHYYKTVEKYYTSVNENINLNYLYYELTDLYSQSYKTERAINTIKKVIYSVDTPQSLMVAACTLLGNIYSDTNNSEDAYKYYQKALESLDENTEQETLAELYFKYALANDERGDLKMAYIYYKRCIDIPGDNPYASISFSNMGSCYYENNDTENARTCFEKAYELDKKSNNYDGIYYNASMLAKIYIENSPKIALKYLIEAKQSAEFINEEFYIMESSVALGDYYYDRKSTVENALEEYFNAYKVAKHIGKSADISKIRERLNDMRIRCGEEKYKEIEKKYERN